jgi:hypothetical protein
MNLKEYFENIPLLHTWDGGQTWNTGGLDRRALEIITAVIERAFRPHASLKPAVAIPRSRSYSAIPSRLFRYALTRSFSIV